MQTTTELKTEILALVRQYEAITPASALAGESASLAALVESLLNSDFSGRRHAERFEDSLARLFGAREALLVNSGTSADLVVITSLTSPRMGKLQLKPGDEVITLALGSPALAKAIVQNQLVPVFVDLALPGFNVDVHRLQASLSSRTRAIALPHLFGNPFDLDSVTMFAAFNNLLLIEDCRDAAGAGFGSRPVGCFGQFATASFHWGRQLSTGEGGAVLASSPLYRSIAESHRGSYRPLEMQAALGTAQLGAFPSRLEERNHNAKSLLDGLAGLAEFLILPESHRTARPSWLELPVVIRELAPFQRDGLMAALSSNGISVRPFSPVLQHHPHRQAGALAVTNFTAARGLLLKVPPAPGQPDVATIVEAIHAAVSDLR